MSSSNPVNYFKEKRILEEEEKALKEILVKFQDQLQRLKIEELALLSHIKMQKESLAAAESVSANTNNITAQNIAKRLPQAPSEAGSSSTITSVVPVGVMVRNTSFDHTQEVEELDLFVGDNQHALKEDLEMEEEEEDDEEMDEAAKERRNHLCSYMDVLS